MLHAMFALFVVLTILDGLTTYKALQKSSNREANPIMAFLFKKLGIVKGLVIAKAIAIGIIWYLMGPGTEWVLLAVNVVYIYVVWNNYKLGK